VDKVVRRSQHRSVFRRDACHVGLVSQKNESIIIDENIVITVVEIRGDKVRLGIQAPREVPIHRSEIHAAIQLEQAAAAKKYPPKVFPAEA